MSFDLEIWSSAPVGSHHLPQGSWNSGSLEWTRVETRCAEQVWHSTPVLPEDVSDVAKGLLPGIAFQTLLTQTGGETADRERFLDVAMRIAAEVGGIDLNPQADQWVTPSGDTHSNADAVREPFSITKLSWWTMDESIGTPSGLDRLLTTIETALPEALPRRYGGFEPPEYTYAVNGRGHFLNVLEQARSGIVWYPTHPVMIVDCNVKDAAGFDYPGFRSKTFSASVKSDSLHQSDRHEAVHRLWRDLSFQLRPFYGEVRVLRGYERAANGALMIRLSKTESSPIKGPWWRGLPKRFGNAAVLGPVYHELWGRFAQNAELHGDLAFLETADWADKHDVSETIGGVPSELMQPDEPVDSWKRPKPPKRDVYAASWPSGDPPADHPVPGRTARAGD